ncbi:MAG: 6-carboxytetrahydropterin synthase QueD [Parachlamydiales bacterium]|jgi:6-pyruvoyltetrahydropterin/6-carboxytetrahydropterin synthase
MFELTKEFRFEAGHSLEFHDGKCRGPHGHSYILIVHLCGEELIASGSKKNMLVDFSDISSIVKPMIHDYFDHKWLNVSLDNDSPSAEFIARWIYHFLAPSLPLLSAITLYETATSKVTYRPKS